MNRPEQVLQKAVVDHLRLRGVGGLVWFHVPNGGRRNQIEGAIFKSLGVRAGVSDLILVHNGKAFALELKAEGGRATESQIEFQQDFARAGGFTGVATGIDQALTKLEQWGLLRGSTVNEVLRIHAERAERVPARIE